MKRMLNMFKKIALAVGILAMFSITNALGTDLVINGGGHVIEDHTSNNPQAQAIDLQINSLSNIGSLKIISRQGIISDKAVDISSIYTDGSNFVDFTVNGRILEARKISLNTWALSDGITGLYDVEGVLYIKLLPQS